MPHFIKIELHKRSLVPNVGALVCYSFSLVRTSATSGSLRSAQEPGKNSSFFFSPGVNLNLVTKDMI